MSKGLLRGVATKQLLHHMQQLLDYWEARKKRVQMICGRAQDGGTIGTSNLSQRASLGLLALSL